MAGDGGLAGGMSAPRYCALSPELAASPTLPALVGGPVALGWRPGATLLAWGDRWPARAARLLARGLGAPVLRLEDGFVRSIGLAKDGAPAWSIVVDSRGMHFEAGAPSDIEAQIADPASRTPGALARGAALAAAVVRLRLDKYNLASAAAPDVVAGRALVVDQAAGDRSIAGAGADPQTFVDMLEAAIAEHGVAGVVVKTHPDVLAGHARSSLAEAARARGAAVIADALKVDDIAGRAAAVWTVSSTLGFEALLRGARVVTFGMPFYAGWGLTDDRARGPLAAAARARRGARPPVATLAFAAFVRYSRFADPRSREPLAPEEAFSRMAATREAGRG